MLDHKEPVITAWNWQENESLSILERKVHALLSSEDKNKKQSFKDADSWKSVDHLTLRELFDLHQKGYHIASGHREEWHLETHGYGSGYTYFLAITVDDWSDFEEVPQSITEYLLQLSEDTINQIAWISEDEDSTLEKPSFTLVFDFKELLIGRVIQEAYQYLSEIPGYKNEGFLDFVPRLIHGSSKEGRWIGGSIISEVCHDLRERAKDRSSLNQIINKDEELISLRDLDVPKLDLETSKIGGLLNSMWPIKKPEDKDRINDQAQKFSGYKSQNWKYQEHTVKEWVAYLTEGKHIAPGHFEYKNDDQSRRSGESFQYTNLILLDVDEWEDVSQNVPETIEEWYNMLPPSISKWITWVGESASSRSEKKPELRLRVGIAFEKAVGGEYFIEVVEYLHKHIPGTALTVAKDRVRLSYGNAREECKNIWYGGLLPSAIIDQVVTEAHEKKLEKQQEITQRKQWLKEEKARKNENQEYTDVAPWDAFDLDADQYLESSGYTHIDRVNTSGWINYSRPGGDAGKPSIGIRKSPEGTWRISNFSTSVPWPSDVDPRETISLMEFYCWNEYNLNITGGIEGANTTNFKQAMEYLSRDGYGSWGKNFKQGYKEAISEHQLKIPAEPERVKNGENEDDLPPYWDIENNKLKHNFTIKRDYYTEPKGNPETLEIAKDFKIAWLDGPPGVAKTTFQLAHARLLEENERKLVAGPRKILSANLASYLNDQVGYSGNPDQSTALEMPVKYIHGDVKAGKDWPLPTDMLTSTIHSMLRALRVLHQNDIEDVHLALDEIDFIIQAFFSPQLHGKAQEILDEIKQLAERHTVFLTGATASTGLISEFVKTLGFTEDDVCQISIEREAKKGGELLFAKVKMKEIIDTIANAVETLPQQTKIFIGFADKEYAKTLRDHPKIQKRGKVQMVTSENSQDEDVKKLLGESTLEEMNIDVLIVSPSVDVGVNLFGEDTQVIIVRAATFGAPVKTSWQQARRVRNTQRPIWYISAEIDWTRSLTLQELQLCKKQKVIDNFIYYISNPRQETDKTDAGIFAELNTLGQIAAQELSNLTYEELMEGDALNSAQKLLLKGAVNRSQLEARIEWEAEQELIFEQEFIEYHSQREGMTFTIWKPEAPTAEEISATSKASSKRKKAEKEEKETAVLESLVNHEYASSETIENKRKSAEYSKNEYEVALEVNNRMQKTGVPDIVLDEGDIRDSEIQRAIEMMGNQIDPTDFQRKYEIDEALNKPEAANERYFWRATKDLNRAVCKPIQAKLIKYINDNLSYLGPDYLEVYHREILHLAEQKIAINTKGLQVVHTLTDAIFIHFPDTLRSYRRMRRYGTDQAKALYTLFNRLLKRYLHRELVLIGEKNKKREVRDIEDIELYRKYFEEVAEAEQYYKTVDMNIINTQDYVPIEGDIILPETEPDSIKEFYDGIEF